MPHGLAQCGMGLWGVLPWLLFLGAGALVVYEAARIGATRALQAAKAETNPGEAPVDGQSIEE